MDKLLARFLLVKIRLGVDFVFHISRQQEQRHSPKYLRYYNTCREFNTETQPIIFRQVEDYNCDNLCS